MKKLIALFGCVALLLCLPGCSPLTVISTLFGLSPTTAPTTVATVDAVATSPTAVALPDVDWYHYNGLSDGMKTDYMALYNALCNSADVDCDVTGYCVDGDTDKTLFGAHQLLPYPLSNEEELSTLYHAILDDHPEFFYISHFAYEYRDLPDGTVSYVSMSLIYFMTAEERQTAKAEMAAATAALTADLNSDELSDYDKELALHDRLLAQCAYDAETAAQNEDGDVSSGNPISHSAYGALCKGLAVCDGYTRAMQLLLQEVGIESIPVYNEDHAWNLVWIDGQPYHLDATWNDTGDVIQHGYFNLTTAEMERTRTIWDQLPPLPDCTATAANFYQINGTDLPDSSAETIAAAVAAQMQTGRRVIELRFPPESYADGLAYLSGDALSGDIYWDVPDSILENWSSYFYLYDDTACAVVLYV